MIRRGDYVRVKASGSMGTVTDVSADDVVVRLDTTSEHEKAAHGRIVSLPPDQVEVVHGG